MGASRWRIGCADAAVHERRRRPKPTAFFPWTTGMEEHQAVVKPLVEGARIRSLADYREAYDKSLLDPEASGWRQRDGGSRMRYRAGAGALGQRCRRRCRRPPIAIGRHTQHAGGPRRLPPPQGFGGPLVEEFHWTKKWEKKNADFHK